MTVMKFNADYYKKVIKEFGYTPFQLKRINFTLGSLSREEMRRLWLCHDKGDIFAQRFEKGERSIVTTGVGLSGVPHVGTISQIMRAVRLQRAGVQVNFVLGDLDAYNGKNTSLLEARKLARRYKRFALRLGLRNSKNSIIRSQYDSRDVLLTSYIIGHYMDDSMFGRAEEDLHDFYKRRGKVEDMSYRRKLSLNLMIGDFVDLYLRKGFENVLVSLGIDEHRYVLFALETIRRMNKDTPVGRSRMKLGAIYTPIIRGLYDYPKMSKSFPKSSITVDMSPAEIQERIINGEGKRSSPEENVVYQMMSAASNYKIEDLELNYRLCAKGGKQWSDAKKEYSEMLIKMCSKW